MKRASVIIPGRDRGDILPGPNLVSEHVAAHEARREPRAVIGYTYGYTMNPLDRTPEALNSPPVDRVLEELPGLIAQEPERWQDGREPEYAQTADLAEH